MPRYSPRTGQLTTYQVGPYSAAHLYLQWGGNLPGGEQWSCGIRLRKQVGPETGAPLGALAMANVTAAVQGLHTRLETGIHNYATLNSVKLNSIGVDGKYMNASDTNETILADIPGGGPNGMVAHPNQVAIAVTTTTGFSRGPAHSGRFYLPMPGFSVGADGLIAPAAIEALDGSAGTFLTALNAAVDGYDAAVFSRKAGAPFMRVITGMKVGRVLDTQRRRRRSLVENYTV